MSGCPIVGGLSVPVFSGFGTKEKGFADILRGTELRSRSPLRGPR